MKEEAQIAISGYVILSIFGCLILWTILAIAWSAIKSICHNLFLLMYAIMVRFGYYDSGMFDSARLWENIMKFFKYGMLSGFILLFVRFNAGIIIFPVSVILYLISMTMKDFAETSDAIYGWSYKDSKKWASGALKQSGGEHVRRDEGHRTSKQRGDSEQNADHSTHGRDAVAGEEAYKERVRIR